MSLFTRKCSNSVLSKQGKLPAAASNVKRILWMCYIVKVSLLKVCPLYIWHISSWTPACIQLHWTLYHGFTAGTHNGGNYDGAQGQTITGYVAHCYRSLTYRLSVTVWEYTVWGGSCVYMLLWRRRNRLNPVGKLMNHLHLLIISVDCECPAILYPT